MVAFISTHVKQYMGHVFAQVVITINTAIVIALQLLLVRPQEEKYHQDFNFRWKIRQ